MITKYYKSFEYIISNVFNIKLWKELIECWSNVDISVINSSMKLHKWVFSNINIDDVNPFLDLLLQRIEHTDLYIRFLIKSLLIRLLIFWGFIINFVN